MTRHNLAVPVLAEDELAKDVALSKQLAELLWDRHALPPVRLASGRGRLFDIFHAVMHSAFLECGGEDASNHASSLSEHSAEVIGCTGDMGVEFGLPTVQPAACNENKSPNSKMLYVCIYE